MTAATLVAQSLSELRLTVRAFLDEQRDAGRFQPAVDAWVGGLDPDFSRELAGRGWVGMTIPKSYGGPGLSALHRWVVTEELLAAGAPVAAHWIGDRQIAPSLLKHGSEAQKRKYLPDIAAAEVFFCLGMSEPDAGSDLAAVRTRAVRSGDWWVLNGTKVWTSHAQIADAMVVLARTGSPEPTRHSGLSQFIVDLPHPGIEIRPIRTIDGHAHFNEVHFVDAALPADALLGTKGQGWAQVTAELAWERSGPERIMSSVPLLLEWGHTLQDSPSHPDGRREFARLAGRLMVLRHLSYSIAAKLQAGEAPSQQAAMVKDLGGAFEQDVVATIAKMSCVEPDFESPDPLARMLAQGLTHGPTFTIRGGSSDILRGILAKGLEPK